MTAELVLTFTRRLILTFLLLVAFASTGCRAQNAGVVGIATKEIQVFNAQSITASSGGTWQCNNSPTPIACPVLPDIGSGAHYLSYCTTAFVGTITLEWQPSGFSTYIPIAQATYGLGTADTACRTGTSGLQIGGYYPNLRSTVTITSGSISAWYSAIAGPISAFPPALGSNGPSSPISCDQNDVAIGVTNGSTAALLPATATGTTVLCGFSVSFNGAVSAGSIQIGWATTTACTTAGSSQTWNMYTTANTPQFLSLAGLVQRSLNGAFSASTRQTPCFTNNSGASVTVSTSYAVVPNL